MYLLAGRTPVLSLMPREGLWRAANVRVAAEQKQPGKLTSRTGDPAPPVKRRFLPSARGRRTAERGAPERGEWGAGIQKDPAPPTTWLLHPPGLRSNLVRLGPRPALQTAV